MARKTLTQIKQDGNAVFGDGQNAGAITPSRVRTFVNDLADTTNGATDAQASSIANAESAATNAASTANTAQTTATQARTEAQNAASSAVAADATARRAEGKADTALTRSVPSGGGIGQILRKATGNDYDVIW